MGYMKMEHSEDFPLAGRFKLLRKPPSAISSNTSICEDLHTHSLVVLKSQSPNDNSLRFEYKLIRKLQGCGVPEVVWFGETERGEALVTEKLGPSLLQLFQYCGGKFSMKTVLMLADQMISLLHLLHHHGFLHGAVHPSHFLIGTHETAHQLHLAGLGNCRRFRRGEQHIPYTKGKAEVTDLRFASINAHLGIEQTRRDDLESLGYLLLWMLAGTLPWDSALCLHRACESVMNCKTNTPTDRLCAHLPKEFSVYLNYCRALRFDMKPDYAYLRSLFRDLLQREHYTHDFIFDWTVYSYVRGR